MATREEILAQEGLHADRLPRHIAIIMDGNGRWAERRALGRIEGHRQGLESAKQALQVCLECGVPILTLYTFSLENWQRPATEVDALMRLLKEQIEGQLGELMEHQIRLQAIGDLDVLPPDVRGSLDYVVKQTQDNRNLLVNLALSYAGRAEIVHAARQLARAVARGELNPEDVDERVFARHLYTADLPDPDLLIRTSGEYRISNFLLWQLAYTELYVTDLLWPDFRRDAMFAALRAYQQRERRFGLTGEQVRRGFTY
ncbi:MAG: isoprenyl transferase [Deltaproteobacteria bacterium]|nr:isoprenyl transferase [Deltaproteobacteria bacterium]MBI3078526.1 isoprenyl transferase [Deltaproteobacteria bacterium]